VVNFIDAYIFVLSRLKAAPT